MDWGDQRVIEALEELAQRDEVEQARPDILELIETIRERLGTYQNVPVDEGSFNPTLSGHYHFQNGLDLPHYVFYDMLIFHASF